MSAIAPASAIVIILCCVTMYNIYICIYVHIHIYLSNIKYIGHKRAKGK